MGGKYDPKGDVRHSHSDSTGSSNQQGKLLQLEQGGLMPDQSRMLEICRLFQVFVHRDDGYLKVRREPDGNDVHLTWTWTLGKNHRSYVYVRIGYFDLAYGLELLHGKIKAAEEGRIFPTPDRYYK